MMKLRLPTFIFAFVVALTPAYAQWGVDSGAVPLGRGVGQTGFNKATGASGAGTKCLTDTTPPSFTTCGSSLPTIANNTLLANTSGSSATPAQTAPGGLWDSFCSTGIGQSWVRLSGGWGCTSLGYANPVWWGCDVTGAADCAAAFNSALATNLPVRFPPGAFTIASKITRNLPTQTACFCMLGSGVGMTSLNWPNAAGGIVVNAVAAGSNNVIDIKGVKITTSQAAGGSGLRLVNGGTVNSPTSVIQDVVIQGDDYNQGSGSHYWNNAIDIAAWEAIVIDRVQTNGKWISPLTNAQGVGVSIAGDNASSRYTQSIKITNSNFGYHAFGIVLLGYWQGVLISQTNIGAAIGIYVPPSQPGVLVQLNFSNSIIYSALVGIDLETNVIQPQFSFNNIIQTEAAGSGGIAFGPSSQPVAIGNAIDKAGSQTGNGISMNADNGIILGNVITGHTTGVLLGSSSSSTICALNRYVGTANQCSNSGTGNSVGVITQ